jgi:putative heme iron utilization protein
MSEYKEYVNFMNDAKSVYISNIDYDAEFIYAKPEISYSPCVVDKQKNTYVLVSDLARRTSSLVQGRQAQIMFIEPEIIYEDIKSIYVRKRLTFDCSIVQIERLSDKWNDQIDVFLEKFGDIIGILKTLADFRMICFTPKAGTFVKGFGQAFSIGGKDLNIVTHIAFKKGEKM